MMNSEIFTTIRQQIARIPAGPGRSADEYVEDLRRTLDCMEVAETLETPAEPLRLREGGWYQDVSGDVKGPARMRMGYGERDYPWEVGEQVYTNDGKWIDNERSTQDLIAEAPAPNTILTPTVPVPVGRNTQIVDPATGCLTELGAALLNGKDAQIAELRKMVEGK